MAKEFKYTLRLKTGNGYVTREVVAYNDEFENGLIRFYDEDECWFLAISVENLIDMEVCGYSSKETKNLKEEFANKLGHNGPVETVLPKEHPNG